MPEASKPISFPNRGMREDEVLELLRQKLSKNISPQRSLTNIYGEAPHPFAARAYALAQNSIFVSGWGSMAHRGTLEMEREAVNMVSSLLNLDSENSIGFMTSGGTESNLMAVRAAKLSAKKKRPEVVMPRTAHFSFRLAANLFEIGIRQVNLTDEYKPRMDEVEKSITKNTIALICSAPNLLGSVDPVKEFAELADRHNLYLHVDSAFGGFILPFMKELGYRVPEFDFSLPSVSSMIADGHKLGLLPIPASFALFRDRSLFDLIPVEDVVIRTISSAKNGGEAAAAWSLFRYLGRAGYRECVKHTLELTKKIAEGIETIGELRLLMKPSVNIIAFTAEKSSIRALYQGLVRRGWQASLETTPGSSRTLFMRIAVHPNLDKEYANNVLRTIEDCLRTHRQILPSRG